MKTFGEPAGRGLEIFVGLVVGLIALIFSWLSTLVILRAAPGLAALGGALVLALGAYWFGQLAYRLMFNRPKESGGLFSIRGLRLWCIFLGIGSILIMIMSIYSESLGGISSGLVMLAGCLFGMRLAKKRSK